jgi:hypothetical protein
MKNRIMIAAPIQVENGHEVEASIQLARTTLTDQYGEHEICPEICLMCEQRKPGKTMEVFLTVKQAETLISKLTTLKDAALSYEGTIGGRF